MRSRLVTLVAAVSGLALIGTGATVAYLDTPDATVTTAAETDSNTDDGVGSARSNLQRAGLPLQVLDGGVGQLTDGTRQLDDGANQLSEGLQQARAGGEQLADGLDQLDGGVALLGDGAGQVSGGVDEVVGRLENFGAMQGDVTAQLTAVADTLGVSPDPVSQGAAGQIRTLVATLDTQGLGPDTMGQLAILRDGAQQLAYELTDPNAQFVAGMTQAADGSRQLRDGLVLLDDGGRALTDGTSQLVDGVAPVANVVDSIADNVRSATDSLPTGTAPVAAEPTVTVGERAAWPFAVLGLGALLLAAAVVVPLVTDRRAAVVTDR